MKKNRNLEIIKTLDGSNSICDEEDRIYHSRYGAIQESTHIFIKNGLNICKKKEIKILEVGFGTGLNLILTYFYSKKKINYYALEPYPINYGIIKKINYDLKNELGLFINDSNAQIMMGHLEINGFEMHRGHFCDAGFGADMFSKFDLVFSGHFHHKSKHGNVQYLGNPYQMYWNDYKDSRGFHIYDTESDRLKFVRNPYEIFDKIFYDDAKYDYNKSDVSDYKDKYIKIIVEEKRDYRMFETLVDRLYNVGAHDVKIVETLVDTDDVDDVDLKTKDTMTLLNEYIDEVEIAVDKSSLKNVMRSLYIESCNVG